MQLKLTVGYSSFIDCKGREQCCSMVLLNGSFHEWPHVVTMLLGKEDLLKEFPALLGQARRRAAAILSAQPWRQRVDIIMYDLQHIAVFRLDSDGFNCLTTPIEFLRHVSDYRYACLSGYYLLLDNLKHPARLGFTWPPLRLTQMDPLIGPGAKAELVCGRSEGKAVFVISSQNQEKIIVKGFECEETAETERRLLQRVQGIPGTALLHPSCADDILVCQVETNGNHLHWWFGFTMLPYCSVLVPSRAEPRHFAALARTIIAVAAVDLVCNDISLDNLLLTESGEVVISDWGLATLPGV